MPQSNKMARVNEDMRREIIAVVGKMKDPALQGGLVSIMRVEVAPDLSVAKVYVSKLGATEGGAKEAANALNRAKGHVRSEVAKKMHIRKTPEFTFIADEGSAYAAHINELLANLQK